MKKISVLVLCMIIMTCTIACGQPDNIDISGYEDKTITFTGIEKKDIVLTIADLKKMDCETIKAESTSDKIGKVQATGVWLDTILKGYDTSQEQFSDIVFYGTDDYSAKINKSFLKDNQIMLAFGINDKPLDGDSEPCRIIIRDSDSAYWTRKVDKIEFIK
ncbi:MAG: molybdopterin-dependent oxidoreductase [Eubacteriaceae bacterium]|nr:molybdopterin-dependent oxidoreductase [Eubacteriaceae bacterium]